MSDPEQLRLEVRPADDGPALNQAPDAPAGEASSAGLPTGSEGAPHPPTPEQAAAIDARDRHVFLEAGAGTGKTRVLVTRYCDAIDLDGLEPGRILAFTFTERAAAEMRARVRAELARRAATATDGERRARLTAAARAGEATPVTTIHGFCRRLLAAHPVAAGLDPRFRVLDAEEASRLAAQAFDEALATLAATDEDVVRAAAGYRWRLGRMVRAAHSDLRNRGMRRPRLPGIQIAALERGAGEGIASRAEIEHASSAYAALQRLVAAFGDRYEELCASRSGVDFDHLQLVALELLGNHRGIAATQRERFDHLLVDEFQDTSPIQVQLVDALLGPQAKLFAVGDEFQSIYSFRGADLASFRRERAAMRERESSEPSAAAVLPLSGSFRSDPEIVAAVNAVGAALLDDFRDLRVGRLPGPPSAGPAGTAVVELSLARRDGWNEPESRIPTARNDAPASRVAEARFLAARMRELADAGVEPSGMVVLLRAFTNVDVYAEALGLAGLRPHVVGGRGYWSAQQVADALRLLACVANPLEDEALLGALASPACGASPDALWMLRRIAGRRRHLWPALDSLFGEPAPAQTDDGSAEEAEDPDERGLARRREAELWSGRLPTEDRERLARFHERLTSLREIAASLPLDSLVERTLERFNYDLTTLLMSEGRRRTANLRKLVRIATEYEAHDGRDLRGFLDHAAARAEDSDREGEAAGNAARHAGVRLMTVHAAKGLEFETVAVADLGRSLCVGGQPSELALAFEPGQRGDGEGDQPPAARVGLRLARAAAGSIDTEGYAALTEEASEAEAEESGRLVYVAASRARRRLILSGVFSDRDLEASERPRRQRSALGCLLPHLGVDGSDGQRVSLEAPSPRSGLQAAFERVEVAVRVIGAGAESAAILSRAHPSPPARTRGRGKGAPPLSVAADAGAAAARSLSYAALADYDRCGYRFLTERVIGLGAGEAATIPAAAGGGVPDGATGLPREWDEGSAGMSPSDGSGRQARLGFGRAVHELLEWSARAGWRPPPESVRRTVLLREGAGGGEADARVAALIGGWLGSPLLDELRASGGLELRPEVPFRMALGAESVMRGTIDLLALGPRESDGPTIVDYKTDRLGGQAPRELPRAYDLQRSLYAAAVAQATGASSVRVAYVFLERPGEPIVEWLGAAEIAAGRARIEALAAAIAAGRYEATPHPHRNLCHDCPARERLCPHEGELTGRADPDPPVVAAA